MALAARIGDQTNHSGVVLGTGVPSVMIGGAIAAVALAAIHSCPINVVPNPPHALTPFPSGSTSVFIGGYPALRVGDIAGCGAKIETGSSSVFIGE